MTEENVISNDEPNTLDGEPFDPATSEETLAPREVSESNDDLTVDELKDKLREQNKKVSGNKDELIARLEEDAEEVEEKVDEAVVAGEHEVSQVSKDIEHNLAEEKTKAEERVPKEIETVEEAIRRVLAEEAKNIVPREDGHSAPGVGAVAGAGFEVRHPGHADLPLGSPAAPPLPSEEDEEGEGKEEE